MERGLSLNRVMGIETEFGIYDPSGDSLNSGVFFVRNYNPSWCGDYGISWDPNARLERDSDARDEHSDFKNPEWLSSSNRLLENGSRFYLDGKHAESSTPICKTPKQVLIWNRACYRLIDFIRRKHAETSDKHFVVFRHNVAGRGRDSSYYSYPEEGLSTTKNFGVSMGCHINYQSVRSVPVEELILKLGAGWFICRIPIAGSGKVGSNHGRPWVDFQISQRADFIEVLANIHTTHNRPIYNLRDCPYGDPWRYRRIHDICSDSNMLELPEYLKVGLTALAVAMIEDGALDNRFEFHNPVQAFHSVSRDTLFTNTYDLVNRKERRNIPELLAEYRDLFWDYIEKKHPRNIDCIDLVVRFSDIVDLLLKGDFEGLCFKLDWVTKQTIIKKIIAKNGKRWDSDDALHIDYAYHNNDTENGYFYSKIHKHEERIITDAEIEYAAHMPPPTKSRWMCEILKRYRIALKTSNYWDRISIPIEDSLGSIYFFFPEPEIEWREGRADELLSLPLDEFLKQAEAEGIIQKIHESGRALAPMDNSFFWQRQSSSSSTHILPIHD